MSRRTRPPAIALSVLLCLLLFAPPSLALGRTETQSDSPAMIFDDAGTLVVSVGVWTVGGAAPAPGTPPKPTPSAAALPDIAVRVRQPDGSDLEQLTDDKGQTTFDQAPGEYLVYLPIDAQARPELQYTTTRLMPDGTLAHDWATAEVVAAQTSQVALQIVLEVP